ncbi:carbon starvation CstA family protein [Urbifossiella limnaea]|uniref:Carbon starvation protein A n=1 Tax=Urbifossiella limnaea TaxID=2528023 RepID=A0A517XXI0_9BACT|nr:carbon starvation protein A [Urbifossiella limnaea]QDU22239.1 Carbon starvation protein A [Urbifossiella limnaea]
MPPFAVALYHTDPATGRLILHAMPVMVVVLCILAVAYRYYSAFLAAKVAALDDSRVTPAHRFNDGQNYHPTNKWVLFGHHFAAISGAGPLIGPVLAIQYGYAPGLVWLVIGVCLAGAVQDMLVLAASVRREGKSLAEIARHELGFPAAVIASVAILFIVVIALAGLGFVVVKALGGEDVKLPAGMTVTAPQYESAKVVGDTADAKLLEFPPGCTVHYTAGDGGSNRPESFRVRCPAAPKVTQELLGPPPSPFSSTVPHREVYTLPANCFQVIPGSSWGTFTIAATIPIALLVGLWMYRIRPGRVVEASLIGGVLTLGAVVLGEPVSRSAMGAWFSLTRDQTIIALAVYGFVAAVLPVWLLLGPRDYLSSFLKIGTVGLLVASVIVANPPLQAPPVNEVFLNGGPTFPGSIFPFVFICIMCGAISGFHALVSSGTTPKMVEKESHIRTIGYGSMLIEGLVGVTALVAAAALPPDLYYDINVAIDRAPQFQAQVKEVDDRYGTRPKLPPEAGDRLHAANVDSPAHLDLGTVEEKVGGESLRGRTGGAVTLAVGMSVVFEQAFRWVGVTGDWLLKYWYHFAIMFEALFILTTIDAGTRIARFLLQETAGRVYAPLARPDWLPGAVIASALVTAGWAGLVWTGSIDTIWPMFGIANQILAVLALTLVTTWLVNNGRGKYAPITLVPMLFVASTTLTAATKMVTGRFAGMIADGEKLVASGSVDAGRKLMVTGYLNSGLTMFVVSSVCVLLLWAAARWVVVLRGSGRAGET